MFSGWWRSTPSSGTRPLTLPVLVQPYSSDLSRYKPREIGCFSVNGKGRFPNDTGNKRYLRPDAKPISFVNFDLMMGYHDKYIRMTMNNEGRLHGLLSWCLASGQQLRAADEGAPFNARPLNFDFVARRGHLAKVFITPYSRYGWQLAVTLFHGTYFLLEMREDEARSEAEDRNNYMGHKFEHFMTSADPGQAPDPYAVFDDNEAFFTVVKASLKSHSLLFSAEVDGQDISYHEQEAPACYVELKTSQVKGDARNVPSLTKLRWWAQSFLIGIPRLIVGFKKNNHTVEKCVMYDVTQAGLRQTAAVGRETADYWRPEVCMNFLDAFLSFVKEVVTEDNHETVYTFSWNPREEVRYSVTRGPEHCFLLPDYVQSMMAQEPAANQIPRERQRHF